MLDKQAVLTILKELALPPEEYLVFSGSVLAVHEIRETSDVDFAATPQLFQKLQKEQDWQLETRFEDNTKFLKGEGIDVASKLEWSGYPTTLAEAKEREDIIDGIPFMSLPDVVQFKQSMSREKDQRDIELIKKYLQANS